VHEYASGLTSTPKDELFCSCKCRKFIGQNEVKICKLWSQNFKFLGQNIGCPNYHHIQVIHKAKKRLRWWPIFSLWTPTNWEVTSWIRWHDTVLQFLIDFTKFFNTPLNLSWMQLNNSDFCCETVPFNMNLLVDLSYANFFQSCKCSGSITENRRW